MALELEQLPNGDAIGPQQVLASEVTRGETLQAFRRAVQNHVDVVVARRPGILQISRRGSFVAGSHFVAQPVERLAQRRAPFLIPLRVPAGIAATVVAQHSSTGTAPPLPHPSN